MSRLRVWTAIALLSVATAAESKSPVEEYINPERYYCEKTTDDLMFGRASSLWELDKDKKVVNATANWWIGRSSRSDALQFMAGWRLNDGIDQGLRQGYFAVTVNVQHSSYTPILKSRKFRFILTSNAESGMSGYRGRTFGPLRRWKDFRDGSPHILADWADIYAMSRSVDELFLVAVDKEYRPLLKIPISSGLLSHVRARIEGLAKEVQSMAQNDLSSCRHEEANNEIIIVS